MVTMRRRDWAMRKALSRLCEEVIDAELFGFRGDGKRVVVIDVVAAFQGLYNRM